MPSERATQLAEHIIDDLRGAAYYAEPKILAGLFRGAQGNAEPNEHAAIEALRFLLRQYATRCATEQDIKELAERIEGL